MKNSFRKKVVVEKSISINRLASRLLEKLLENPASFGVKAERINCGATIIDAGVEVRGGFEAGRRVTEICMGGCGKARITHRKYGDLQLPSIFISTDLPAIATLGSQYAGWQIHEDGYFAICSGPARALALKPREIYEEIDYEDNSEKTILVLETAKRPPTRLMERIAKDCRVTVENMTAILTPTTSIAGVTQVAGRIVETGIHKLRKVGLDPNAILHAWGCAPIPPIHPKFANAMARTNDAILYGGIAYYVVKHDNEEELKEILQKAPSKASKQYGRPFIDIFKEAKYDFYKIDPSLFAPARITINNVKTGSTFTNGEINTKALAKSLGFETG
jgi:methenyltetrahydromethanopterin cyclohydrolase